MSIKKIKNLTKYLKQQTANLKQMKTDLKHHSEWNHTPELVAKYYEIKQIVIRINEHIIKSSLYDNYFHYTGIDTIKFDDCTYATGFDTILMIDNHMAQLRKKKSSIDNVKSLDKYVQEISQLNLEANKITHKYLLYDVWCHKEATTEALENTIDFLIKSTISDDLDALQNNLAEDNDRTE